MGYRQGISAAQTGYQAAAVKVVFRASCVGDIDWFRKYYGSVFPQGRPNAKESYRRALRTLQTHPETGNTVHGSSAARELHIPRTPFSFIYVIEDEAICVIRVLDGRARGKSAD